jgi:hypothetical protein
MSARARRLVPTGVGLIEPAGALMAGVFLGTHTPGKTNRSATQRHENRDIVFQGVGARMPNQGRRKLKRFYRCRYRDGIADREVSEYLTLRKVALDYLTTTDVRSGYISASAAISKPVFRAASGGDGE